jgi:hypothetical protein
MRNLLFAGNTGLVLGYSSYFESKADPDITEAHPVEAVLATAPRTGRIAGFRTNIPIYGCVVLGRLKVGDRTIYEAAVRPTGYVGMRGVDIAHPMRECKRITPFAVEEGQVITADLSYSGLLFPGICSEYQYTVDLEWLYEEECR